MIIIDIILTFFCLMGIFFCTLLFLYIVFGAPTLTPITIGLILAFSGMVLYKLTTIDDIEEEDDDNNE